MLEGIADSFREVFDAMTTDSTRIVALFLVPLVITGLITAAYYTIFFNSNANTFLNLLAKTGACNTIQPYLITATFENNGVLGYCQVVSFNIGIFLAWYLQILILVFIAIYIFVNIFHMS
jgi:hypothetical protein